MMSVISEATGFVASTLVLMTFTMKDMRMLRIIAILSNVAFIGYGMLDWLPPVLFLHTLLLPLNIFRLRQMQAKIVAADRSSASAARIRQPRSSASATAAGSSPTTGVIS